MSRWFQICLLSWLCLASMPTLLSVEPDPPGKLERIQSAIYRLDFSLAEVLSRELVAEQPDNPEGFAFLAITKWNVLLQAAGNLALDDYATPTPFSKGRSYKRIEQESSEFEAANDALLEVAKRVLQEDPSNVKALYFEGLAYENSSVSAFAIRKETGQGVNWGRRAMSVHKEVLKLDPQFVDAKLSLATGEFAAATLPWSVKWLAFLLGYRGDKEEALEKLEEVIESGVYRKLDAQVVMAVLNAWKGDANKAVEAFRSLGQRFPENYLIDINVAAIYEGDRLGNRKAALAVYENLLKQLGKKAPGLEAGEVHYRIGKTYFGLREYSKALDSFQQVLASKVVEQETVPLSHYYMALIHERQGAKEKARGHYRKVLQYPGPERVLEEEISRARKKARSG